MKRSRSEHVTSAVGQYLKRRQYADSETFKKSEFKLNQSLYEMTLQGSIGNESSTRNAVSFNNIELDVTKVDQEFNKLKTFISEAEEPLRTQLTYVLFPVFVHLYLELINNGHKTQAQKFRSKHHGLFLEVPDYHNIIEELLNVNTAQDISKHQSIKSFSENKYTVRLADDVVEYLTVFLKKSDNLIILQVLNLHVEIKTQDPTEANKNLPDPEEDFDTKDSKQSNKPNESKTVSAEVKALQDIIKKVRDGPPSIPSICLYSFTNSNFQGLSSSAVNSNISLLAGGFENSSISLWSLTPTALESSPAETNVSHLRLSYDRALMNDGSDSSPSEMKILRAHAGTVYGLSFVPKAPYLISCSEDTTIRVWCLESHTNKAIYRGHNYPVWDVDVSSIGHYFASGSLDKTARLWHLDRTFPVQNFVGHNLDVDCVKFHPNSNYLATGSTDKTVRLWNVNQGKMVRMFQGHRGTIFSLAFSPNGQLLASAGEDRRIKIWDLSAGSLLKELRGHLDTVYSLCFNNDSSALVSGGLDNVIRVWDVRRGVEPTNTFDSHTSPELLAAFPTKGTCLQLLKYSYHNMLVAVG